MSDDSPVLRIRSTVIGEGERVFVLGPGSYTIGRGQGCDVVLLEQAVSREHARIERDDTGFVVTDLDSATGLFVDGERVARRRLHDGHVIKIGDTTLQFVASAHSQPTLAGSNVPTELADDEPSPLFSNVSPPAGVEGADTWVSGGAPPSSLPTQVPGEGRSTGTEVAAHVPAPPSEPDVTPSTTADTDPAAPAPMALPVHAPPPPQAHGSQPAPHDAPSIPPMPRPAADLQLGPAVRSGPSVYELGDMARVGGAQSSSLDLQGDVRVVDERPPSTLGASRTSVGAYIGMFVVGLAIAIAVAVALYGIP